MSTIQNARDVILQAATVRLEPVTLPPSVTIPAGQIGAGSLSDAVKAAGGNTIVHQGNFQAQTVIADQIDTRGLTIKDAFGTILFSAGVNLSSSRISGLGALASQSVVNLATQAVGSINALTQVTNLGGLAYASTVAAEQVVAGSFAGKVFTGGEFNGTTFNGVVFNSQIIRVTNLEASGYLDATNVFVDNDVRCSNLYTNILSVEGTLAGSTGARIVKRGDSGLSGSITLDGVAKNFTMTFGF